MTLTPIAKLRTEWFALPRLIRSEQEKQVDAPQERGFAAFVGQAGAFASGYWEGDPGEYRLKNYPVDEFCFLLEGEIEITAERGETQTLAAGDAFVIPRGFTGTWKVRARARKLFACAGEPRAIAVLTGSGDNEP